MIKEIVEPGPILSEEKKIVNYTICMSSIPETNVFGTSGIISIETGGRPGCKARVTAPKVTSHVSKLPIFCGT
jgi:hypothetical protein